MITEIYGELSFAESEREGVITVNLTATNWNTCMHRYNAGHPP